MTEQFIPGHIVATVDDVQIVFLLLVAGTRRWCKRQVPYLLLSSEAWSFYF